MQKEKNTMKGPPPPHIEAQHPNPHPATSLSNPFLYKSHILREKGKQSKKKWTKEEGPPPPPKGGGGGWVGKRKVLSSYLCFFLFPFPFF